MDFHSSFLNSLRSLRSAVKFGNLFFLTAVLTCALIYCDSKPRRGNPVGVAVCGNFKKCPHILCHPPYQLWGFQVPSPWLRDGCVFLDPSCRAEVMLCSHVRPCSFRLAVRTTRLWDAASLVASLHSMRSPRYVVKHILVFWSTPLTKCWLS